MNDEILNQEIEYLGLLNDTLSAFEWLLNRKYKITLAFKGKETEIELVFLPKTFIHLAGINKLTDISLYPGNASGALYRSIVKDGELRKRIVSSSCFNQIIGRLYSIIDLKENFEDAENNRHFKFVRKVGFSYTLIDYNFFILSEYGNDKYYYFLRYSGNLNNLKECVLISTFIDNIKDYSIGQEPMTLLEKIVVELDTGTETIIYTRKS